MDFIFETKFIEFNNKSYKILLQNENGPCALVALVNIFILSSHYTNYCKDLIKLVHDHNSIQLHDILEILADVAIKITTQEQKNKINDIDNLLLILPELHKGLNVNLKFNGEFTTSNQGTNNLFEIFGTRLVHGWIMDSSNEDLRNISFEEVQVMLMKDNDLKMEPKVKIMQSFLHDNPTQLSSFGLSYLYNTISNDEFTILFRNNHFSTLYKKNDILYTLVTDIGFKKYKNIVWQSLITINGSDDVFFDGNFNESPLEMTVASKDNTSFNIDHPNDNNNNITEGEAQLEEDKKYALKLQEKEDERVAKELSKKQRRAQNRLQLKSKTMQNSKISPQSKQKSIITQADKTRTTKVHSNCTIV